jgi:hypothetical protein
MSVSQSDLDNFHHFASQELSHRGAELSLDDLLNKWRAQQEQAETMASIRRGVEDANSGRVHDLADVDAKIRTELGFPARR